MKNSLLIIVLLSLFPFTFISSAVTRVTVEGVIVSYNKKTVTLSQNGKKIKVPRKLIPYYFKIQTGNTVYAELDPEKAMKVLKKTIKKQKMNKNNVQK